MKATLKWTVKLQNSILKGLQPVVDPYNQIHCYIADGWGSTYASMRLRKISLDTGSEIVSFKVKNSTRCIHINENKIFAATDSKIYILNRETLTEEKRIDKNVLKYPSYIESNNKDSLLIMTHRGSYLMILDYIQNNSRKKKIASSCNGIYKKSDELFMILDGYRGEIYCYDLRNNTVDLYLKDNIFAQSKMLDSRIAYLREGSIVERQNIEYVKPSSRFRIIDLETKKCIHEFQVPLEFDNFYISNNKDNLFLLNRNKLVLYSVKQKEIIDQYTFDDSNEIISLIEQENPLLLIYNHDQLELSGYSLNI